MQFFKSILSAFYPNTCIARGDIIDEDESLCAYCFEMLPRVDLLKNCIRCGLPKKDCDCKNHVFYYNGCIAPFYNDATAKVAMYKFKFRKAEKNADFFVKNLALTVKTVYRDIKFDAVTYVPLTTKKNLKRGFNQSKILASKLAEILGLPLFDNLLYCKQNKTSQHDLKNPKDRFKNVEGLYGCMHKVKGNILLIDDIKTTGATLNECAKQLILSGADKIYCATGLITYNRKDKK